MANFGWLNDIPDEAWHSVHGVKVRTFAVRDFQERSGIAKMTDELGGEFQQWAATQPRRYEGLVNFDVRSIHLEPFELVIHFNE